MPKFQIGDVVYYIESGSRIYTGGIINHSNGRYTICRSYGCGVKLPESRLYATYEEAEKHVTKPQNTPVQRHTSKYRPFWYAGGADQ